jgi:hypothetical protein
VTANGLPLATVPCEAASSQCEQREVDMARDFRGTEGTDAEEASLRLEPEDVLEDDSRADVLDLGYAPQDRPWAVNDWGTTAYEEESGESLDGRLAREMPDAADADDDGDGLGDVLGTDGELRDDEVGDARAGRLRERDDLEDNGGSSDDEPELLGWDAGIDGGGAAAEEAAVHIVP